jgi:sacsin
VNSQQKQTVLSALQTSSSSQSSSYLSSQASQSSDSGRSSSAVEQKDQADDYWSDATDKQRVLSAVAALLQRANLPLSLEAKSLLSANMDLKNQVDECNAKLAAMKLQNVKINSTVEKIKSAFVCCICMIKEVNTVLVKCGHMMCDECVAQLPSQKCPQCRERIISTVPFFSPLNL